MKNTTVQSVVADCHDEFKKIEHIILGLGRMHHIMPFLTKYAIIRACGAIEFSCKTIISDAHMVANSRTNNFIDEMLRNSSMNPSLDNIRRSLNRFDENLGEELTKRLKLRSDRNKIESSLKSLNQARNAFAHGGHPTTSFEQAVEYFNDSLVVVEILDDIV
jgi:hypothetical protein